MVKFLLVRFSSIGDIVLTTPVIRHLKEQVDDAEIHYLTKKSYLNLLEHNPHVDKLHSYNGDMTSCLAELKAENFDYIIDLHHNARSARIKHGLKRIDFPVRKLNWQKWLMVNFKINRLPDLHMVDRNLETIKAFIEKPDGKGMDFFIPGEEKVVIQTLPESHRKGYVGLVIGAQHETKKLPTTSLIELCSLIKEPIVILGGPEDREQGDQVVKELASERIYNACGRYSILQSASLVDQASVVITHDTGLMHIAAALGKKIISLWGNTIPEFGMYPYQAHPDSAIFEVEGLKCRPCSKIGHQKCPKGHFKCMKEQNLKAIAEKALELAGKS